MTNIRSGSYEHDLSVMGCGGNNAKIEGELKSLEKIDTLCGNEFHGYLATIETMRLSGVADEVRVVFAEDMIDNAKSENAPILENGCGISVSGAVHTLRDPGSCRVRVFVLAERVELNEVPFMTDQVTLRGVIASKPKYRKTPMGRQITEIFIAAKNEITGKDSFIPCICWQKTAIEVADWGESDKVELVGRFQSRQFEKVIDKDKDVRELRTVYEISVHRINRLEIQEES